MFTRAIVRPPASNFYEGLTTASLGIPEFERAVGQHAAYGAALEQSGLTITRLEPDPSYPDSTFVEDTAILTEQFDEASTGYAVITRPGAPNRRGEVTNMRSVIADFYPEVFSIEAPGTLDGGDVCQAGNHFFIGLSERTNETGAQQLVDLLAPFGYSSSFVDIRGMDALLHLKSGLAYLGDNRLVITERLDYVLSNAPAIASIDQSLPGQGVLPDFELVRVNAEEAYAANCVRINDYVLLAAGYPLFTQTLKELGYQTIELEMSEFQKMDGGLSCLSLRF
jgi:dimethylargininase